MQESNKGVFGRVGFGLAASLCAVLSCAPNSHAQSQLYPFEDCEGHIDNNGHRTYHQYTCPAGCGCDGLDVQYDNNGNIISISGRCSCV